MVQGGTSYTTPSYRLEDVKKEFSHAGRLSAKGRVTGSARKTYVALGMGDQDVFDVIQGLNNSDFYKTMPKKDDPMVMQDVYHSEWKGYDLYIKFVQNSGKTYLTLLSCKEKD